MHKNATKCNETLSKWCKNKHGASKIIDTFETYQISAKMVLHTYTQISVPSSGMEQWWASSSGPIKKGSEE
jgi:hypothetical protein